MFQPASPEPFIVTVTQTPAKQTSLADVIFGAFGVVAVLAIAAVVAGVVLAVVLVGWNRRHPPEGDHPPPVVPVTTEPNVPPSARVQ